MSFSVFFGFSNIFGLPLAVSWERDLDWGDTSVGLHVGPLVLGFTWQWS